MRLRPTILLAVGFGLFGCTIFPPSLVSGLDSTRDNDVFRARVLSEFPIGSNAKTLKDSLTRKGFDIDPPGRQRYARYTKAGLFGSTIYSIEWEEDLEGRISAVKAGIWPVTL